MRTALFGILAAACLAATPLTSKPANALALPSVAGMVAAADEVSVAPQNVYYGYRYYRPWRPAYYGGYYRPWRPYYRPAYYGYGYRPWRPYFRPVFYGGFRPFYGGWW